MSNDDPPVSSRLVLVIAAVAVLVIRWFVPFGAQILYPFTLLATWVHEMGHGLMALLLGGGFQSLDIFADASGIAHTRMLPGWRMGLVAAGGLLAPAAVGASILALSRGPRRVQVVLWALSGALLLSLLIWVRSFAGWISIPLLAAGLGAFARYGSNRTRMFMAQLVGLLIALDVAWTRVGYFFTPSAVVDGVERASDISLVASAFLGPYQLWGALLALLSFAMIGGGLFVAWRRPKATRPAPPLGVPTPESLRRAHVSVGTFPSRDELEDELEEMRASEKASRRR